MIRVLIVDDSVTVRSVLRSILDTVDGIEVVGVATNGKEAVEMVASRKPDLVTMDIDMPVMDGMEATRRIMSDNPVPIIVVTISRNANDNSLIDALAAGALTLIEKPAGIGGTESEESVRKFVSCVKTYSQVKVIRRKTKKLERKEGKEGVKDLIGQGQVPDMKLLQNRKFVLIGVSSGGPMTLMKILSRLTGSFPYPILVVQHITEGFLDSMVSWLNGACSIPIEVASLGVTPEAGKVYFAPDNLHMTLKNDRIELLDNARLSRVVPSVAALFRSVKKDEAKNMIAMILTGMGSDGAQELKTLRNEGALTFAQDESSSLVFGMPGEAKRIGAAQYILSDDQITELLVTLENN